MDHLKSLALVWLAGSGGYGTVSRLKAGLKPLVHRREAAQLDAALEELNQEGAIELRRGSLGFAPQGEARALQILELSSLPSAGSWAKFRDDVVLPLALRRWLEREPSESNTAHRRPDRARSAPTETELVPAAAEGGSGRRARTVGAGTTWSDRSEPFSTRFDAAFAALDRAAGGHNYVTLDALRRALPDVPRATFDAELSALRRQRRYTLDPSDGRHHQMTQAERDAGIMEAGSLLVYVAQRRDPSTRSRQPPREAAPPALEDRIRAAYLRVTQGELNKFVKLAQLRAELPDEATDEVDVELRRMQQRGGAVLYPIDDPQRIRAEDHAAALYVAGERRDLFLIKR